MWSVWLNFTSVDSGRQWINSFARSFTTTSSSCRT
jgi:hypothetical protein